VLICDNLPENGKMLRGVVLDLARRIDPALADWIEAEGRFPSTMVDRITPAMTTADIDRLAKATGHFDAAPVFCEPFRQWVVEDDFVGGIRPDLTAAGVEMVPDVTPYEHMKLKMLNGTHSALAYLGYLGGHETISDTVADPVFAAYVRGLWADEIAPAVDAPEGVSLTDYATALFDRYANPAIRHRTWQIAMDGSQKLPQRILGTLEANFAAGRPSPGLCLAVAAWMRYVGGVDEEGQPIEVKDPMAAELRSVCDATPTPQARVKALLGLGQIFPEAIASKLEGPVTTAATLLWQVGARKAAAQMTETST
jgi:fructuronate reductase